MRYLFIIIIALGILPLLLSIFAGQTAFGTFMGRISINSFYGAEALNLILLIAAFINGLRRKNDKLARKDLMIGMIVTLGVPALIIVGSLINLIFVFRNG